MRSDGDFDRDRDRGETTRTARDRDRDPDRGEMTRATGDRGEPTRAARARVALAERWARLHRGAAAAWGKWRADWREKWRPAGREFWREKCAPWLRTGPFRFAVLPALTVALLAVAYYAWAVNRPLDFGNEVWVIAPGETLGGIAARLVEREIIGETWSLRLLAKPRDLGRHVRSGAYRFPPRTSLRGFLRRVVTGAGQVGIKITFIEGWTFARMREELRNAPDLQPVTADMSDADIMAALGAPGVHPEGRFFPDTYRYAAGRTDLSVFRQAYRLMQDKLAAAWDARADDVPLESADEALIIASIIEKESQIDHEQRRIAGVFYNRLRKGMRLQTDPTVIYGLGDKLRGKLRRKHLRIDTPYNTYTRYGLPPTPISLPGADALRAAVDPAATKAYYFVAKGGGAHHFSVTLEQHNRAVRRYARGQKGG